MEESNNGSQTGCVLLIIMVIVAIVMITNDVNPGIIILVMLILSLILVFAVVASVGDNEPKRKSSYDSSYSSVPESHHIHMKKEYDSDSDRLVDLSDDYESPAGKENKVIDKETILTREEFQESFDAIQELMRIIKRMSYDAELRDGVINRANDKDTFETTYDHEDFYATLQQLLAKDIIYCYDYFGLNSEMTLITPENQLLLPITMEIIGQNNGNDYSSFRQEILSTDPINKEIRDVHKEMYNVFRDNNVRVSIEGIDDFMLIQLVKLMNCEGLYLNDLRKGFNRIAALIAETSGMNKHVATKLECLIQREKEDDKEMQEAAKEEKESEATANNDLGHSASMDDINDLIGLKQVKNEVLALKNFIEVNKRREEAGLKSPTTSYHCIFTGNPGTGKTTVARIVASIYKDLGILKKGHLVETDRSGLVAEYVGQTAVKTNKIIDSALDGVLFIDEAYSLLGSGREDYGKEAIATLVKRMEDDRNRLVVILAGYADEMEDFIKSNPGLRSRFNRFIHFEDYTAEELKLIFANMVKEYDFQLMPDAELLLKQHFKACVANKGRDFGNARYVRNLFERVLKNQAIRLAALPESTVHDLATITLSDIQASICENT